jgi:hypothetical protein
MTTYNLSANIRNSNVSQTQNVDTADTVVVTLSTHYTPTITATNASVSSSGSGSSSNSTITYTITFSQTGAYSVVLYQGYAGKTYTLTGTATGTTNYGHGLILFDASGNPRLSPLKRQPRIVGSIGGLGPGSSFTQYYTGFNSPSSAEWAAVQLQSGSNYYVEQGTTSGRFTIARADVRTSNSSYQTLSNGLETYKILILRY